jgi:lipopolysaccharide/colanic/teichoic acid biosynthesis glycosyltransferase
MGIETDTNSAANGPSIFSIDARGVEHTKSNSPIPVLNRIVLIWLVAADIFCFVAAFELSINLPAVFGIWWPVVDTLAYYFWQAAFASGVLSYLLMMVMFGLYPGRGVSGPERIKRRTAAALVSFAVPSAIVAASTGSSLPIALGALGLALIALLAPLIEIIVIEIVDMLGLWRRPVLLRGTLEEIEQLQCYLRNLGDFGFLPVGQTVEQDAERDLRSNAGARLNDGEKVWAVTQKHGSMPVFSPLKRGGALRTSAIYDFPNRIIKRVMDLTIAGVLLLPGSVVIAIAALMVVILDGRPMFYSQARRGRGGKQIKIWKIRSMSRDAEVRLEKYLSESPDARCEWETHFKLRKDPRVLPYLGNLIRKTSIDELPQLWNILRGDISIIGPRPFPDYHLNAFSPEFRALRQSISPGLSGLWQVTLRSDANLRWQEELDTAYIENWSIWLDLYILARTPIVLLTRRGAH